MAQPWLHDEIAAVLNLRGNEWMTTAEIAATVQERGRYRKRNGGPVTAFQVHGRTRQYTEMFEREGARVRLRRGRRRQPQPAPTQHLMYQWKQAQWSDDQAEGREGEPLSHAASDAPQFLRLRPGDRLYIVGQWDEKMLLLGRMDIARLMTRREAEEHFGEPVYDAEHHVLAAECTAERFDRVVPERVARSITSVRGARVAFASQTEYRLLPSSLQPRLWLTAASAQALDNVLDSEPRSSESRLDLVAELEKRTRRRRHQPNARQNRAVERRAMVVAKRHYEAAAWEVEDVSASHSFDLLCTRSNGGERYVEVKGTSAPWLDEVIVTRNEVLLAQRDHVDLAVVSGICLSGSPERPRATAGTLTLFESYRPTKGRLTPLTFAYHLASRAGTQP